MSELKPNFEPLLSGDFPFPLAEPKPEPVMITRPCGCTFMVTEPGATPFQVSWCVPHDPGYTSPGAHSLRECPCEKGPLGHTYDDHTGPL